MKWGSRQTKKVEWKENGERIKNYQRKEERSCDREIRAAEYNKGEEENKMKERKEDKYNETDEQMGLNRSRRR
jgi:hypothetical protein